ncbi:molybdopterin-dependent oxidoreductase [Singulisphaera sp. PoT]|uniref:molybdopterin-dependent oxidoreductase n=1 Tax=Singulisphaera sp. PoT TaxID=3411797 RepID=UPI003BF5DAE5
MATIIINGQEHQIPEGEKLNAIQMASRVGVEIPYYCWHPSLSVVANCRMCEIEVGSKDPKTGEIKMIPKLVPGCQTPAKDQTVIVTDSAKVKEHQRMIMEYLLINHPLDCPVCDQAGECGLQDYSYENGQSVHRFVEERTVNPRKDVSDLIQLNQDRCIMCTRCVRFTREITQTGELQVMRRGNHAEIDVFPGLPVENPLAGNVVDLCPVGALLDKDFLHNQRVWFLSKHDGICTGCSTGCNISAEENRGALWRLKPRYNPHVNDYWICDEGRYSYKSANDPALLSAMYVRQKDDLKPAAIDQALKEAGRGLRRVADSGGKIALILSPFLTVEEAFLAASYVRFINPKATLAIGPIPTQGEDLTITPDLHKGRNGDTSFLNPRPFTIHAEKCPNRKGVEAVIQHFQGQVIDFETVSQRAAAQEFRGIYILSDAPAPAFTDEDVARLRPHVEFLVVQDTHVTPLAQAADVVLAGATFAEKAGSYVNADGRLQYAEAALPPRDGSLPDLDLIAILLGRSKGPIHSKAVLAEVAATVPAFAVAKEGKVHPFGEVLGVTEPQAPAVKFRDAWTRIGGARGVRVSG